MNIDWIRDYCMSLPGATEEILWEEDLVFKVGGKMFAVVGVPPDAEGLGFKASPEEFEELTQIPGITPNKYMARYQWVTVDLSEMKNLAANGMTTARWKELLRKSHELVAEKLPRKTRAKLGLE